MIRRGRPVRVLRNAGHRHWRWPFSAGAEWPCGRGPLRRARAGRGRSCPSPCRHRCALADGEAVAAGEILAAIDEETLKHDADDARFATRHLIGDGAGHEGLATEVLAAVAMAGVDHHPGWQASGAQGGSSATARSSAPLTSDVGYFLFYDAKSRLGSQEVPADNDGTPAIVVTAGALSCTADENPRQHVAR